jgi:hypothetical protein
VGVLQQPATSAGMTVKFQRRAKPREGRRFMKKPTVKYSKGEIGRVRILEDFLPSPDRLVLREVNANVASGSQTQQAKDTEGLFHDLGKWTVEK